MKNNKGIILKDLITIIGFVLIIGLAIFMIWYSINYFMKIENARGVAQEVEQTAINYYRNFLLRPEDYGEITFDLTDKENDLYVRIVGRRPEDGEVFIRPINELTGEISVASYLDGFCAIKYYRETKYTIKAMNPEECILDNKKLDITGKNYKKNLNTQTPSDDVDSAPENAEE